VSEITKSGYEKKEKTFGIKMFGINEKGKTVCIYVINYTPFFYVKVSDTWTDTERIQFVEQIKNEIGEFYGESILSTKLINRKKLYGFDGGKTHNFIEFNFKNNYSDANMSIVSIEEKSISDVNIKNNLIDKTQNLTVNGFPTIGLIVYKNDKPSFIQYNGSRTKDEMIAFIKKNVLLTNKKKNGLKRVNKITRKFKGKSNNVKKPSNKNIKSIKQKYKTIKKKYKTKKKNVKTLKKKYKNIKKKYI